jgi:NhaP-type Na+/H+ or K+/H+ antiporter
VSPTDAVATSIVKRVGVSGRVVSVLEGESLLNDATALVLLRTAIAGTDYLLAAPLGWRDGGILVWAGMRGAITLAAAQTLPDDAPHRSLLVLIAFIVAATSLLIQGSTLARFVAWIKPASADEQAVNEERGAILALLRRVENDVTDSMPRVTEASTANPAEHTTPPRNGSPWRSSRRSATPSWMRATTAPTRPKPSPAPSSISTPSRSASNSKARRQSCEPRVRQLPYRRGAAPA